jgi:hypothetical protein
MPNTALTEENIKKRIEVRLGSSMVNVEFGNDDVTECIEQALELYNQMRPMKRRAAISVSTSQKRYVLASPTVAVFPGIAGVVDVQFITRRTQPAHVDPFDPFDTALAGVTLGSGSGETYGEIFQRLSYSEDAARVVDSEPEWESLWEGNELVLYLDIPRSHIQASFEYSVYYSFDTNANTGMQLIPQGDVGWFLGYSTAVAKTIVGRIRSKHGGTIGPDGGTEEIDGAALIDEGRDEIQRLEEALNRRRVPLAPTTPE